MRKIHQEQSNNLPWYKNRFPSSLFLGLRQNLAKLPGTSLSCPAGICISLPECWAYRDAPPCLDESSLLLSGVLLAVMWQTRFTQGAVMPASQKGALS